MLGIGKPEPKPGSKYTSWLRWSLMLGKTDCAMESQYSRLTRPAEVITGSAASLSWAYINFGCCRRCNYLTPCTSQPNKLGNDMAAAEQLAI